MSSEKRPDPLDLDPMEPEEISRLDVPWGFRDRAFWRNASRYQLIYSVLGLILGLACVVGGVVLFLRGVTGATSWTAKIIGAQSKITDAAPGAILFIVGLFVVWITRFSVKLRK